MTLLEFVAPASAAAPASCHRRAVVISIVLPAFVVPLEQLNPSTAFKLQKLPAWLLLLPLDLRPLPQQILHK